jgi:subtilisin family serine protease
MESNDYIQDSLHFDDKSNLAYNRQPVVVGIFDTGIDPLTFNSYFYTSSVSSCIVNPGANANNGWNFVAQNSNWGDDYPSKHGTQVTGFVVDQSMKFRENSVNILPIKIHDHNGHAGLFNVLCAFAYASNRGAKIINASFGYYAAKPKPSSQYPDSCALLIKAFVKKYTTDRGILLIAAAGNSGNTYEDTCRAFVGLDKRNLDQVGFYPASLGADTNFRNVMAVTTVDTRSSRVSPRQNYSPNVVDIGVQADTVDGELFLFIKPRLNAGFRSTVEGSSFATPIVTGIIASHYFKLDGLPADKSIIIATLRSLGLAESNPAFVSKIKNGIIMHK